MATNMHEVVVVAGTEVHLDDDCPSCGWSDLWRFPVHSLTGNGVGLLATITCCVRCNHRHTERHWR